jgi:tetratricopeptide (TPR) repeat protein
MKKKWFVFQLLLVFFFFNFAAEAQNPEKESAFSAYQTGRDLESRNRRAEADPYYNEAIRICNEQVARNEANGETYTVISWTLLRQNKYAEVVTWGDRGLRLYPNEYRIIEALGEAWFYLGDYRRSLSFFQRYTSAIPNGERTSIAFFFIGEIYRLTQRYRHADIAYTTAVRLSPNVPLWWYRLALAREGAGDKDQAIEAVQRAIRLDPNYQNAIEALARLQGSR